MDQHIKTSQDEPLRYLMKSLRQGQVRHRSVFTDAETMEQEEDDNEFP